jgi:hypothetical protein
MIHRFQMEILIPDIEREVANVRCVRSCTYDHDREMSFEGLGVWRKLFIVVCQEFLR